MLSLDALRQRLHIKRWFICGQSFGAALTLRYALRFPERTIAQAFTNTLAAFQEASAVSNFDRGENRVPSVENGRPASTREFSFHPVRAKHVPEAIKARLVEDADAVSLDVVMDMFRFTLPQMSLLNSFPATSVPTVLVNGMFERKFQPFRTVAVGLLGNLQAIWRAVIQSILNRLTTLAIQ